MALSELTGGHKVSRYLPTRLFGDGNRFLLYLGWY